MKEKLTRCIEKYLEADTPRKKTIRENTIIAAIKDAALEMGHTAARTATQEVLQQFGEPIDKLVWLQKRLSPCSLNSDGWKIYGWWNPEIQVIAELLPLLRRSKNWSTYGIEHWEVEVNIGNQKLWEERGFSNAVDLPFDPLVNNEVRFPITETQKYAALGYALPCRIQWRWRNQEEGLEVIRSIPELGFLKAWSWYGLSSQWWYLENRPELFHDFDCWWGEEEKKRYEPPNDPYAAVLGGQKV